MVRLEWVLNMKTYTTYQVLGRLREQVEIIADHLGTIAQCLNTSTYKLSDQFFERIAVALEGHCGK